MISQAKLSTRGVLEIAGDDASSFLQGLITNDIRNVTNGQSIYAALLSPQGKFLHDFIIAFNAGAYLLETEAARTGELAKRFSIYKLRSKVTITDRSADLSSWVVFGDGDVAESAGLPGTAGATGSVGSSITMVDPRNAKLGLRIIGPKDDIEAWLATKSFETGNESDYDRWRIQLGVPDGSRDMEVDRALLLENGFEQLNGVDFDKGCYVGQEVTARSKHRATLRKFLHKISTTSGNLPAFGTAITAGDMALGEMRSSVGNQGLALIRQEELEKAKATGVPIQSDGVVISDITPAFCAFPS